MNPYTIATLAAIILGTCASQVLALDVRYLLAPTPERQAATAVLSFLVTLTIGAAIWYGWALMPFSELLTYLVIGFIVTIGGATITLRFSPQEV